jgi:SAM-dependent methyltransferase
MKTTSEAHAARSAGGDLNGREQPASAPRPLTSNAPESKRSNADGLRIAQPMRRISGLEHAARYLVLRHAAPACLRLASAASALAPTRFRRSFAIERHVRGRGLEVGAAATPATVPIGTTVTYVDKYSAETLRADPELKGLTVRAPDVLDSAETLSSFEDDSQDFVLGFSLLEHVQDALGSIGTFHRVCRDGGSIIISVPDKRHYGPDRERPLTTLEHFVRDYKEGPAWSRADHFREVGRIRRGLSGAELEGWVAASVANDAHTHFHVWDPDSFLRFLLEGKTVLGRNYDIREFASYGHELLAVLTVIK